MANYNLTQTGDEVQAYIDSIPVIDVTGTLSGSVVVFTTNPYPQVAANYEAGCGSIIRLTVGEDIHLIPITRFDGTAYSGSVKSGDNFISITASSSAASGEISTFSLSFSTGEDLSDVGIDATPTADSENLVESKGVVSYVDGKTKFASGESVQDVRIVNTPEEGSSDLVSGGGIDAAIKSAMSEVEESITPIVVEGNVTNAPDEEDLTSEDQEGTDVLKFKDKVYAPVLNSGLGRIYLRKNYQTIDGQTVNLLTSAMVSNANTIYHIQYDYDLNGATIQLPSGCVLKFEGGSLKNGTLQGNNTSVEAKRGVCIFKDGLSISGTWDINEAYSSWFNCAKDGYEIEFVFVSTAVTIKNSTTKKQTVTTTDVIMGNNKWRTPMAVSTGDGSISNPYTIAQAISSGAGEFYMKFYPMGICNGETLSSSTFVSCTDNMDKMVDTHIVIADSYNGAQSVLMLTNDYVKSGLNLKDNYVYASQPMVAKVAKTSDTFGVAAFNCVTLGYYEKYLNNSKTIGDETSDNSISSNSTATVGTSKYKIVGDNTYYTAQSSPSAEYTNDGAKLQQLINLGALHSIIEEGTYMIDTSGSRNIGLLITEQEGKRLTIDGTLKAITPSTNRGYRVLGIESCYNYVLDGAGKIQGDLPEHNGNIENGMCLAVSSTPFLRVEGLTFEYAMCDCAYIHWRTGGSTLHSNVQHNHKWYNCTFHCGRRTGFVYEHGDDVLVENCRFEYNGKYRGIATFAAVDIEPFGSWDNTKRYVENYTFSGNYFDGNRQGLRIERCANVRICDNTFKDTQTSSIIVMENKLTNASIDSSMYMAKYQQNGCQIYNNSIYGGENAISFESSSKQATASVFNNLIVSCSVTFIRYINLASSRIYNNTLFDTSLFCFGTSGSSGNFMTDVVISDNTIYSDANGDYQNGTVFGNLTKTTFSDTFVRKNKVLPLSAINYNGIGQYGLGGKYPSAAPYLVAFTSIPVSGLSMTDNEIDDIYLWYNANSPQKNTFLGIVEGIRVVNEDNYMFLAGDTIDSKYKQKGIVTQSGTLVGYGVPFEAGMMLYHGMIITNGGGYDIIYKGGVAGDSWANRYVNGASAFKSQGYADPHIKWETVGTCTSSSRPTILNTQGRRLRESDTGLLIEYDGTRFVVINDGYKGTTANRPILTAYDEGVEYYDTSIHQMLMWDGTAWKSTGNISTGTAADIPISASLGDSFYVTTEKKPIWFDGSYWRFADGTIFNTNIQFADTTTLKPLAVSLADTHGDGEVSYAEAKAVTAIGTHFRNSAITSFDEFQYFTGVTSLGAGSFSGCNSITSITFPASITEIKASAMYTSGATYTVTLLSTTPPTGGYPFNGGNKPIYIYVPDASVNTYKSDTVWSAYANLIKGISEK